MRRKPDQQSRNPFLFKGEVFLLAEEKQGGYREQHKQADLSAPGVISMKNAPATFGQQISI